MKVINVRVTDKVKLMGIKEGDSILNANFPLKLAEGNYKSVIMNFEFASSTWTEKSLTKFATFKINESKKVQVELTSLNGYANACYVPYDVFQENCKVEVGVYGIAKSSGNAEKIVSTEVIKMLVVDGSYNEKLREENDITSSNAEKLEKQINDLVISLNEKANKSDIPINVSELINDRNYIDDLSNNLVNYYLKTEIYTKDEVKNLINAIKTIQMEVVTELPATGKNNIIYLIARNEQETNNIYDEYIYVNDTWEKIGSTDVDLTNYALKSEIPVKNSQLQNDSGFITDYIETDPTVPNCVKNISQTDISNWNSKANVNDIPDVSNFITQLELETILSEIENLTVKEISVTNQVKMLDIDVGIYKTIFTQSGNVDFYYSNGSYQRISVIAGTFAILIRPTNYGWLLLPGSTVSDSNIIYIGTIGTSFGSSSKLVKESQVLLKTNTSSYTPTAQYHPATKKYVDTTIKSKINATFALEGTTLNITTEV